MLVPFNDEKETVDLLVEGTHAFIAVAREIASTRVKQFSFKQVYIFCVPLLPVVAVETKRRPSFSLFPLSLCLPQRQVLIALAHPCTLLRSLVVTIMNYYFSSGDSMNSRHSTTTTSDAAAAVKKAHTVKVTSLTSQQIHITNNDDNKKNKR